VARGFLAFDAPSARLPPGIWVDRRPSWVEREDWWREAGSRCVWSTLSGVAGGGSAPAVDGTGWSPPTRDGLFRELSTSNHLGWSSESSKRKRTSSFRMRSCSAVVVMARNGGWVRRNENGYESAVERRTNCSGRERERRERGRAHAGRRPMMQQIGETATNRLFRLALDQSRVSYQRRSEITSWPVSSTGIKKRIR